MFVYCEKLKNFNEILKRKITKTYAILFCVCSSSAFSVAKCFLFVSDECKETDKKSAFSLYLKTEMRREEKRNVEGMKYYDNSRYERLNTTFYLYFTLKLLKLLVSFHDMHNVYIYE